MVIHSAISGNCQALLYMVYTRYVGIKKTAWVAAYFRPGRHSCAIHFKCVYTREQFQLTRRTVAVGPVGELHAGDTDPLPLCSIYTYTQAIEHDCITPVSNSF